MAMESTKTMELSAALMVGAVLVLATVFLSVQGLKGADDTPLNGGESQAAGATHTTPPPATDPATDIYTAATACDQFSDEVKSTVPVVGGQLPDARTSTDGNSQKCDFQLRKGGWLTVTSTWFPVEGEVPGYQRANDQLAAGGGTELGSPTIGTAARLRECTAESCGIAVVHHNLLLQFDLTIGERKLQGNYQQALLRIASDYAALNFQ